PFLAVDKEEALAREHEEVLLGRLSVVAAVRLARVQDAQIDPQFRELRVLEALEAAEVAEHVALAPPGRVPGVDDDPARAVGLQPALGVDQPCLLDHAATLYAGA